MKIKKIIAAPRAIFKIDIYLLIKYCLKCYKHRPRESLRKTIDGRNYLNFKVGSEKMNKELDISRILLKLRMLNNFMKLFLETDQRKLLKLRSAELIESDFDERAFNPKLKESTN